MGGGGHLSILVTVTTARPSLSAARAIPLSTGSPRQCGHSPMGRPGGGSGGGGGGWGGPGSTAGPAASAGAEGSNRSVPACEQPWAMKRIPLPMECRVFNVDAPGEAPHGPPP